MNTNRIKYRRDDIALEAISSCERRSFRKRDTEGLTS